jgi:F-type H+-transporting ATPase subunit b
LAVWSSSEVPYVCFDESDKKTSEHTAEAVSDAADPHAVEAVSSDADHADAGHAAAGHDGGHDTGVPLSVEVRSGFLFADHVSVVRFRVLGKFAWGPMIQGLDNREAGIQKAISDAEESRRKSQAMLAEYEQKLKAAEQTVQVHGCGGSTGRGTNQSGSAGECSA